VPQTVHILITVAFPEKVIETVRDVSPRLNVTVYPASQPEDIPREIWAQTEILYTARVLPSPDLVPKLRWIQFHYTAIDFVAQHPIMQKTDLVLTTLSGPSASQVAEYVMMALLALGRRLPDMHSHQMRCEWPSDRWERFAPLELRDSTVGIIGYGSIGRQVARLLQPFGARILAVKYDAMHPEDLGYTVDGLGDPAGDFFTRLYPPQAIKSVIKECDFVVVCTPLTPATRHIISSEEFDVFKPTAFIVNVSRGHVVDDEALLSALTEHKVAGAALDVFATEPLPVDSLFWKLPNVIITPHIAGNSAQYSERGVKVFVDNLRHYLSGMSLYNEYDRERGY
jgi:phosphoglycerate dehydrogenase-like enzyme